MLLLGISPKETEMCKKDVRIRNIDCSLIYVQKQKKWGASMSPTTKDWLSDCIPSPNAPRMSIPAGWGLCSGSECPQSLERASINSIRLI